MTVCLNNLACSLDVLTMVIAIIHQTGKILYLFYVALLMGSKYRSIYLRNTPKYCV